MGQDQLTNQEIEAQSTFEPDPSDLKACCAAVYQSEWARLLLGDSFHPGGLALTEHLASLAGLTSDTDVLDVAAGTGATATLADVATA